ncbi:hypothetical protein F4778DRAFT_761267 [Xylariomycetidae sp. FL2044]|nr:hypothetical protein F4778DRAFT_761267 [Xylariomycetidae sp. FL2044]
MPQLKVLVNGGGIAGNAIAFWLSKLGYRVTVLERFPALRVDGLQLDLRGHGIDVMKKMGLEQVFKEKRVQEEGAQFIDSSGRRLAYFPASSGSGGVEAFTSDYEIMRGDLCKMLHEPTKDRATYKFGTSVEDVEELDDGVRVRFTDGAVDQFDLLIGADGVGSRIRKIVLGPGVKDPFVSFQGLYAAHFTMPRQIKAGEKYVASIYLAPGRKGIMTRRSDPTFLQVMMGGRTDLERLRNAKRGDTVEEKAAFAEFMQDAGWQAPEMLEAMKKADDFYCERLGFVKMKSWSRGRITLVGDAAWCPSVWTGMGTTSALVGCYVLAGEIGRHIGRGDDKEREGTKGVGEGLDAALKAYEEKFMPFMDQVQEGLSEKTGSSNIMPASRFGVAILKGLVAVIAALRLNMAGKWFIKEEDVVGWELPEYKELLG